MPRRGEGGLGDDLRELGKNAGEMTEEVVGEVTDAAAGVIEGAANVAGSIIRPVVGGIVDAGRGLIEGLLGSDDKDGTGKRKS